MELAKYRVWLNNGIVYYPVRKSASSSLNHAFGGRPVDMRRVPRVGVRSFTVVRNPFDRLASLYARDLKYSPFADHGIYEGMELQEFVDRVCETREPYCDQHLYGAAHTTPNNCQVYWFEDLLNEVARIETDFGLTLPMRHSGSSEGLPRPQFTPTQLAQISVRYAKDLDRFYENHSDPESCRLSGKTTAKVRQEASRRAEGFSAQRGGTPPTDSPSD